MVQTGKFQQLIAELKRRRVFRVATLYVVAMWPIIQIADILSPALNLPNGAMQTLLMVFIAGFPIALILAWVFNLTPKGLIKVQSAGSEENPDENGRLIGKNIELLIVGILVIFALSLFVFQGDLITRSIKPVESVNLSSAIEHKTIESIAVLPFVPFSSDKQDEYFADGLSEELLNVLAKIKTLRVAARTSSFAYKGVNRNIQTVGKELGVDAILEGSVRRNDVDNTIRVTAQLIDVRSGTHLWSETYDRQFKDIFKIQDEITAAVVGELKITLLGDEQKHLMAHESANPEAMVAHSMGRTELAKRTAVAVEQSTQYFLKAVKYDPGYATAFASLSESYVLSIGYADKPRDEYREKAQKAVDKSLELDPELGLAWAAQGLIYYNAMENTKALEALEKAIELNPSYAMAYMWYGSLQDDPEKRTEYYKKALQLDPRSPVAGFNVANNLVEMGKDNEAMEVFSQIVEADPYYPGAYMLVAQISKFSGRIDQAIVQYKKAYELGKERKLAFQIANLYIDLGDLKNTEHWLGIAKNGASKSYQVELNWLNVAKLFAEGNEQEAEVALAEFTVVKEPDIGGYYRSVFANYLLKNYIETTQQFELLDALRIKKDMKHFPDNSSLEVYIYAAYAYLQQEQFDKSNALLEMVNVEQERRLKAGERISSNFWYRKSLIQSVSGEHQLSLINLQRAIDEGWSRSLRINAEPIFEYLKEDSNFKAMLVGLEARMNLMREQLAFEESFNDHWKG